MAQQFSVVWFWYICLCLGKKYLQNDECALKWVKPTTAVFYVLACNTSLTIGTTMPVGGCCFCSCDVFSLPTTLHRWRRSVARSVLCVAARALSLAFGALRRRRPLLLAHSSPECSRHGVSLAASSAAGELGRLAVISRIESARLPAC